jgi:hypothetical protein
LEGQSIGVLSVVARGTANRSVVVGDKRSVSTGVVVAMARGTVNRSVVSSCGKRAGSAGDVLLLVW